MLELDGQTVGIHTSAIAEKCKAFETLVIYCSTLGGRFAPTSARTARSAPRARSRTRKRTWRSWRTSKNLHCKIWRSCCTTRIRSNPLLIAVSSVRDM
ncbi:hypothetical protein FIBSPDRAFT_70422 [Athelia psychrophila]|uniref:Uncharacterized protein n=1 Tax=Athelia psychrophila TaxID=1759441 RepID=A0A166TU63_9AGAM|nr:hypothetical protein FIBSPDRAFT_70422 [Fibularhizoctonia sp. CBS 109695]